MSILIKISFENCFRKKKFVIWKLFKRFISVKKVLKFPTGMGRDVCPKCIPRIPNASDNNRYPSQRRLSAVDA